MKDWLHTLRSLFVLPALLACGGGGGPSSPPAAAPKPEVAMKPYLFVLLRRGPAWIPDKTPETEKLFEGHMANISAMAKSGKLLIAGPMDAPDTDRQAIAGIFIFDNTTRAELDVMLAKDPAIAVGRLVPEILTWYGPVGLTYAGKP